MSAEILQALREVQLPLLAVLLLFGALTKLGSRDASSGLSVLLPARLRRPAVLGTGLLEAALAAGLVLLSGVPGEAVRLLTALVFAASVAVLLLVRRRDPEAGCGCFGGLSRAPIGWRTLTRAGLLSAAALLTLGLEPTAWQAVLGAGPAHAAVLGAELLLLAALSPELRGTAARLRHREPCELREVSERAVWRRLRRSDVWRTNRPMLLDTEPLDTWRHGCHRFLRYDGLRHGTRVDVVFAVRIGGRRRTAVRAAVVDRGSGTSVASFGAVSDRELQGPPRRLPGPRRAARLDARRRDEAREAASLGKALENPSGRSDAWPSEDLEAEVAGGRGGA
ncbi:MauE/DoxX family redox-associated membrane protein [Nocardiopsis changdeensis]|uniref:MauE/DoxX family redox-associated membrane protein n=1 Tax=Nocardiopsis TaxID=2013 RepID=UPI0021079A23|nr:MULTISPECIES: MauE/DoxX family redox-associated membrane protein [Nocardiopsis]